VHPFYYKTLAQEEALARDLRLAIESIARRLGTVRYGKIWNYYLNSDIER